MYPTKKLSEICSIRTGKKDVNYSTDDGLYPFFTCWEKIYKSPDFSFDWSAILIAWNGDVGACKKFDGKFEAYQRTYVLMDFQWIERDYLFYFLNWNLTRLVKQETFGSAIPYIKLGSLTNRKIPLPPLSTQSKIVAKLDEAFGNIDRQISLLKANIDDVERVRKSAMEELISDNNNFKILEEIITNNDLWLVRWQNEQSDECEIFYIKMNNLWNFNGRIVLDKLTKVNVSKVEKEKYLLRKWDFLFNTRNSFELVWKTALFDMGWEYLFNNNILRIRFLPEVSPHYINYVFLTSFIQNQLHSMKSGTTNVSAIYFKNLKNLQIPLPPLSRQQEIVEHLDRIFAQTADLRSSYEAQIRDLETLRQSLLDEAFAGRLVSE